MGAAVLNKVREYRWELWLFIGLPVAVAIATLLGQKIVEAVYGQSFEMYRLFGGASVGQIAWHVLLWPTITTALLAISYWQVNKLERPVLKIVWLYALLVSTLEIARYSVIVAVFIDGPIASWGSNIRDYLYVGWALFAIEIGMLVWFARKASRNGFDKALVLISASGFLGATIAYSIDNVFRFGSENRIGHIVTLIGVLALTLVVVWMLKAVDTQESVPRNSLAMLFVTVFLSFVAFQAVSAEGQWGGVWEDALQIVAIESGIFASVVAVAYLVRKRLPKDKPSTKDSNTEEPIDRTTLLYGGSWRDSA